MNIIIGRKYKKKKRACLSKTVWVTTEFTVYDTILNCITVSHARRPNDTSREKLRTDI